MQSCPIFPKKLQTWHHQRDISSDFKILQSTSHQYVSRNGLTHAQNEWSSFMACRYIVAGKSCHPNRPWGETGNCPSLLPTLPHAGTLVKTVYKHTHTLLLIALLLQNHILSGLIQDLISSDFCMLLLKAIDLFTQWHSHEIDHTVHNSSYA